MKILRAGMLLFFTSFSYMNSQAAVIDLAQWVFNVDGTIYESSSYPIGSEPLPSSVSGVLDASGLGSFNTQISGAGEHSITLMLDYEIDEMDNSYFNEYGASNGVLADGQSWEIDEPGYIFGDIYWNTLDGMLDNSNGVPMGLNDDVSMALSWGFTLAEGETADINFYTSTLLDTSGFYLAHFDPETGLGFDELTSLYFWSDLTLSGSTAEGSGVSVPEPSTLAIFCIGLMGLVVTRRRYQ